MLIQEQSQLPATVLVAQHKVRAAQLETQIEQQKQVVKPTNIFSTGIHMVSDSTSVHAPQSHANVLLSLMSSKRQLHILADFILVTVSLPNQCYNVSVWCVRTFYYFVMLFFEGWSYTQMALSLKELWIKLLSLKRTPGDKVLQGLYLCRHVISGTAKTVSSHTESPIGLRNPQVWRQVRLQNIVQYLKRLRKRFYSAGKIQPCLFCFILPCFILFRVNCRLH